MWKACGRLHLSLSLAGRVGRGSEPKRRSLGGMIARRNDVRLPDGRRLAYDDAGDPAGRPLLFFHGLGASRRARHPDDGVAAGLGVRLLTVDRPGIGGSDPLLRRRLLDWPGDVAALADELGLDRFAVAGWSAGGPHALACAA